MGLDMMMYRRKKSRKQFDYDDVVEVAYWRKANQIHNYFVEKAQKGVDDCGYYKVSKKVAEKLLTICKELKEEIITTPGKMEAGYTYKNGEKIIEYENGLVIANPEVCEKMLPTVSGFFFGSTDYNEYYIEDIDSTIEQMTEVLETTDFDKEELWYHSSW